MRRKLALRRQAAHQRGCLFRELLLGHCGAAVASFALEGAEFDGIVSAALDALCRGLEADGDSGLVGFSREIEPDDGQGPDPLLFNVRVLLPNAPLSGLVRAKGPLGIPPGPTLAHLMRAPVDSALSPTVRLVAGEWYSRFYYEIDGVRPEYVRTIYLITPRLLAASWSFGCPVLVQGSVEIDDLRALASPSSPTGLWLSELTLERFDGIIADPTEWTGHAERIEGDGFDTVLAVFASTSDPIVLLALVQGAAAAMVEEECAELLAPIPDDHLAAVSVLNALFARFPYTFPLTGDMGS